ncbi:Hypothetical protein FKW44_016031, partial [Caligus rogercresseyi]
APNELNTTKFFKLAYSANRCRCDVKLGAGSGTLPRPSNASPVVKNPPRKAHKDPVTAE